MSQVSRPMQIALGATLLLLVVWFLALRPKPDTAAESAAPAPATQEAPAAPGTAGLTKAIDKARGAVVTANGETGQDANGPADDTATAGDAEPSRGNSTAASRARHADGAAVPHRVGAAARAEVRQVRAALHDRKAIAIAFVDPVISDARAVEQEMRAVSNFDGKAFTISVPLAHLAQFGFITRTVEVTVAPTVVIVAPNREATTIVGFTDRTEIEQRLADALLMRRRKG